MHKLILILAASIFLFLVVKPSYAIYDPLSKPNNFFGIHILFTTELEGASKIVNSSGGDWGYVTIPIQSGDRDLDKWQQFMNDAYDKHLIPILRLATESYYKDTAVWRKPTTYDVVDFANFLNSLYWPSKNRYVILFNEVNRFDEWGGEAPNPEEYADTVNYAIDIFKSKSPDFFLIMSGLDNASPNDGVKYMDNFVYLNRMAHHDSTLFNKIDGFSSHSYPNPDFAQSPNALKREGIATYKFEQELISQYASSKKPVFITETGWNGAKLSENLIADYFKTSLDSIWGKDKDSIVAITPFILESKNGAFDKFTFIKNNNLTEYAKAYQSYSKTKAEPFLNPPPPPIEKKIQVLGVQNFKKNLDGLVSVKFSPIVKFYFKSILGI